MHTATQKLLTSYRLKNLEERLRPHRFFRVHRKYLVNLDLVTEIASLPGGNFMLRTAGKTRIELPIGRRRIGELKQFLGLLTGPRPARRRRMEPTGTLETLLVEERVFRPAPATVLEATVTPAELAEASRLGEADPLAYWEKAALELEWHRKWDNVLDVPPRRPFYRWFPGARTNIVHNALDRHVHFWTKNKLALIWEGEAGDCRKFTYFELYREVNRLAGALRGLGVGRGDRVCLFLPPIPETVVAMLATAKIGAAHVFVFAGYSAKFLRERLNETRARVLITADGFYRGGRCINLKTVVDEALLGVRPEVAESVVVVRRTGGDIDLQEPRDRYYHDLTRQESPEAATEIMAAGDPLFLLPTSGATGKPKAVIHAHGGYMVGAHHTFRTVFDIKPTDIHFCTADPGWVTGPHLRCLRAAFNRRHGHPLRGPPPLPPGRPAAGHRRTLRRHHLLRHADAGAHAHALRAAVPEKARPHDPAPAWQRGRAAGARGLDVVLQARGPVALSGPRHLVADRDRHGHAFAPCRSRCSNPVRSAGPCPGWRPTWWTGKATAWPPGQGGFLVLRQPWPAMLTGLFNDPDGYRTACWERIPGVYFTGDVASQDEDGYFWIKGRADEVLNIAGHRVGTAEIEAALTSPSPGDRGGGDRHPGQDQRRGGQGLHRAGGQLEGGFRRTRTPWPPTSVPTCAANSGPSWCCGPWRLRERLPRTQSGKILRRVLRAEELGQPVPEVSIVDE